MYSNMTHITMCMHANMQALLGSVSFVVGFLGFLPCACEASQLYTRLLIVLYMLDNMQIDKYMWNTQMDKKCSSIL